MDYIIYVQLATICPRTRGFHSYRKEFAPFEGAILSCKSAIPKLWKKEEIIPASNDLVTIAESLEECVRWLLTWKEAMQEKGLRINAGKTKIMICSTGLDLLQSSGPMCCLSHWSGQQQHLLQRL